MWESCRAGGVGLVFAGAGDRHLQQQRGEGAEEGDDEEDDGVGAAFAIICAPPTMAPQRRQVHEHGERAGDGGGDRTDEDVAVAHVRQLVGDHALELLLVHDLEQTLGGGDGGVAGIAAGGEGVGRRVGDDVDLRHGEVLALGQLSDDAVEGGRGLLVHLLRVVHAAARSCRRTSS